MKNEKFVARKDTVDQAVAVAAQTASNTSAQHHNKVMATLKNIQEGFPVGPVATKVGVKVTRKRIAA